MCFAKWPLASVPCLKSSPIASIERFSVAAAMRVHARKTYTRVAPAGFSLRLYYGTRGFNTICVVAFKQTRKLKQQNTTNTAMKYYYGTHGLIEKTWHG